MNPGRWRMGAIACAAVLLGGCSGDGRSFEDLADLANAVASEGVPCDRVQPRPATDLVNEIGACSGSEVTLYVFDDAEAIADWKKVGPLASPAAVGSNWAVTGERAAVERIADGLDGEMTPAE